MTFWLGLLKWLFGIAVLEFGASQDRKEFRNALRERIILPNIYKLDEPAVRARVVDDILSSAYGLRSLNMLGAVVLWLVNSSWRGHQKKMLDNILRDWALQFEDNVEVYEDEDDVKLRIKRGRTAIKDLVRDITNLM